MRKDNVIVNMVIDKIRFQQIGNERYEYDANGNPILVTNDSTQQTRELYWDEENRLMVLSDNGKTSRYTYNHAGERIVKSHGDLEGVYINGAPQGITFHEHDDFTLYPASIISINKNRFTKHYFIGSQRIASKLGSGQFNNVYGRNGSYITAGQQDYAERLNQIEQQRENYYQDLGIAPGVPTMKGAYGDPENTGVGYNTIITELGDHSVPKNWAQYVVKRNPGETPGPPIIWSDPLNPEDAQPGYGFIPDDSGELEETFFYHSDHLGSTSYITDDKGNITQYTAYLPYGELLVDEHSSSEDLPYKFNGKELDEETGLYYYGARYLQPVASIWYGADPLFEKYPSLSAYNYCAGNPIRFIDPTGMFFGDYYDKDGKFLYSDKEKDNFIYVVDGGQSYKLPYDKNKFLITANIIKHESMGNAEEALWIAHTANNAKDNRAIDYRNKNNSLYDQLMDQNYSTTPASARLPISSENNSSVNMGARAAVIDVLMGGQDPTSGAVLWDGVDFMQKGLNHNKFKEYKSVTINQEAFNDYQKGIAGYSSKIKVNPLFEEGWKENTWQHKGTGKYYHLYSTGSRGATIFWNIKK